MDKIERNDLIKAYKQIFNTDSGKKVLDDLANKCFYNKLMFTGNSDELNLREGMRNVYLLILKMLKTEEI